MSRLIAGKPQNNSEVSTNAIPACGKAGKQGKKFDLEWARQGEQRLLSPLIENEIPTNRISQETFMRMLVGI